MKKFFKLSFVLVFMLIFTSLFTTGTFIVNAESNDSINLTIVHTNDTHARVEEGKYAGMGFAKIAAKINELRKNNKNVLVLDAGDTFHGQTIATISKGESIVKIMNTIGYDAMVVGNHDFNYGQKRLLELAEKAKFPLLAANVEREDGTKLLKPYIIKKIGGLNVGIFGLATPETVYKTHPKNVKGLVFKDPVTVAKQVVAELKDKTDIIIALTHLGMDESSKDTSIKVAKEVDGIDIIVDGHSHTMLPEGMKVNGTLIVQTGEYDKNLGIVNLTYKDGKITSMSAKLFTKEEAANLPKDEKVVKVINEVKSENEKITSVVVGNTDIKLDGERAHVRTRETNLGNLIATAMLKATNADVALTNGGGIRASIEPGEITQGEIITVLPFGNYVVVKEVKGSDLVSAIEHGISSYPEPKGAFPHVAGMTFKFDPAKKPGNRLIEVKVAGQPIDLNKTYKLATNDFLAAGGDDYKMFADDKILGEYPALDEILVAHIQKYGVSDAKVDGRIAVAKKDVVKKEKVSNNEKVYVVVSGDVLWKIAEKFNLSWQDLAKYNKLKNPHFILPGQKLLIPVQ
ncbi:5'-nucleotidase [Caminicella sporogenes DSM 14501]|uniref:5'-nucleotidase n=1 Tax=Caminicella sporogenes DSM 14501 TaxID=1121266 RepID=A0A1M6N453_9FIRM|nr:5'-nucleotidase C-terminal domain-containing protein [Caminicella sporogenes]RKD22369.1 multifunctional 2',3'-cyclic-nucleotide 2'-phosphodiesterase/5'-nucleotidase/3'-nucleotidase [Caminicella sporogenes]SHJ90475.1 5'-nucleotidase [Caminicella sporogenes DSM 14501]